MSVYGPTDCVDAWLALVLDDPVRAHGYGPARSAIFDAVRADRTGRVVMRLFALVADPRAEVRLALVRLLTDLGMGADPWDKAADLALVRLQDVDERVRRGAAWLLAVVCRSAALAVLDEPTVTLEPVARLAVVEAVLGRWGTDRNEVHLAVARRLCDDRDPAVRLRAALETIRLSAPSHHESAEAVVLATLATGGDRIGGAGSLIAWGPGELWAMALVRQDREDDCYRWIARLLERADEVSRRAGVDMAHRAMRHWRAAPSRVAPMLLPTLASGTLVLRQAAARALGASLEASRNVADGLADRLSDPDPQLRLIVMLALARIGDARSLPGICALIQAGSTERGLHGAVTGLTGGAVDTSPLVNAAQQVLARVHENCSASDRPDQCSLTASITTLRLTGAAGSNTVPQLVAHLNALLHDTSDAHQWQTTRIAATLGSIGPQALAAIPLLEHIITTEPDTSIAHEARFAIVQITGERARAEAYVDECTANGRRRVGGLVRLLTWLADNGGLTTRHASLLREMASRPRRAHPGTFAVLWRHAGATAADQVLAVLPEYLDDDLFGPLAARVLGEMGALARPALPALDALLSRTIRVSVHIGDVDAEMRADELIVAAAADARSRIVE